MTSAPRQPRLDAVVIGRNEGARLVACLEALTGVARRVVYVDSGSTDDSVDTARAMGAQVIALDLSIPFTAARARNEGFAALADTPPEFVQFIDGDCALRDGWAQTAMDFLDTHPEVAIVCGRRRERFPQASRYNGFIDAEWNTPIGEADACGGDALMRYDAIAEIGGYRNDLIAGEEPEMCLRLRKAGWKIWRLDAEMTWHDAQITRFGQWWSRTKRAGYAFAEGSARFSTQEFPHWDRETRRIWIWGLGLPIAILILSVLHPWFLALTLIYPLQVARLTPRMGLETAVFTVLGKFAEAAGAVRFYLHRLQNRRAEIIEYK